MRTGRRWVALGAACLALGSGLVGVGWWLGVGLDPDAVETVSAAALAATLAPEPALPLSAQATDVVLVNLCTFRQDRLETYGHSQPTSPFLRRLSAQGVWFAHNFAQAPWTRPSMAALVTGLWPRAMRIDDLESGLLFRRKIDDSHTLLAEHLAEAGYATLGVVTNPNLSARFGFAQGFDVYDEPGGGYRDEPHFKSAAEVVDTALALAAAVPAAQRLYLRVNMVDTHKPRRWTRRHLALMDGPRRGLREYDAAVRGVDAQLARLLVRLKETRPNLLFVVAADHGEGLMLPRHHGPEHGNYVYRSTVETPLIWHHPALAAPGRAVERLSMNIDVVPTILDLLGLPAPTVVDGRSQARALRRADPQPSHRRVFSETFFRSTRRATVFDGEFQLIRTHPEGGGRYTEALYTAADRGAEEDVRDRYPDQAAALAEALTVWEARQARREAAAPRSEAEPLDARTEKLLQALGYLE